MSSEASDEFGLGIVRHEPPHSLAEETFRETFTRMNTVEDMNLNCRTNYGAAIQSAEI